MNLLTKLLLRSGAGVPAGGFVSVMVADATAIDPQSSIGASGSGWVALVTLKGITSLVGTVDASALTLSVTDPGYDTSGNVISVARTITGVAHLRRQNPNGNSKVISTDGTDVTMLVTLDDWVYSGTSIVSASIGSAFYPACAASSAPVRINLSTQAYPKPLFGWINAQQELVGATAAVEAVAFHRHARNGQQVAAIRFNATDGTNNSADVLVGTPTTSTLVTQGNIPEVWAASISMSALTQGAICTANAQVYPWIGDSSAVLDVRVNGTAWPTVRPITPLRLFCDRTGAYSGGFAYVSPGAPGGTVSATPATASADPYPTIGAALTAMAAWNNTNKSHNNLGGGVIRLKDNAGAAQTHTISAGTAAAAGLTWCTIEKDPASSQVVTVTWGTQTTLPTLMRFRNLRILPSITYNILGNDAADSMVALDKCTVDVTTQHRVIGWYAFKYLHNITMAGTNNADFQALPNATAGIAVMAGFVGSRTSSTNNQGYVVVGNDLPGHESTKTGSAAYGDHGRIVYNNRFRSLQINNPSVATILEGFANVQNLYEYEAAVGGVCMNFLADGDLTTISNYVEMHNTSVGERASRMYNDAVGTRVPPSGIQKLGVSRYNIWDNYNIKADNFMGGGVGSVGTWAYSYGVGNSGNVSLFGSVQRTDSSLPSNNSADGYLGEAWLPTSQPNLFRTSLGFTQAQIMDMFTSYTVQPRGAPAAGGNYIPLAGAVHIRNRVPVGLAVLRRDLAGTTRRTDGTGAAGAYESA